MVSAVYHTQHRGKTVCDVKTLQVTLGSLIEKSVRMFNGDSLSYAEYK